MLTHSERARYSRHLLLSEIGEAGQEKLRSGSVLLVGAGGLGSPAATYLAAAGVGTLGIVEYDVVDETNLHRQILYGTSAIGRSKFDAARERIGELNPHVRVVGHETRLTSENAMEILAPYDVIVDGTDNFATRYLVNDACVLLGKPDVYGSVFRFEGQVSVFGAPGGPCYRCIYPVPPPPNLVPSCAEAGVLGVLPGIVGTLQATEAIKLITGIGETLAGRLLLFDALGMTFRTLKLQRRCEEHDPITQLIDYEEFCTPVSAIDITPSQLAEKLALGEEIVLIDVREPFEWSAGHIEGATHIPLVQVPARITEIPKDRVVVMICRSGGRSGRAQEFLRNAGYDGVKNMVGGMQRWAREVDPKISVA